MEIIFVLLPLTILLAVIAVIAFVWALDGEQFEDVDTPALRVLFDDGDRLNDSDVEN